MPRSTASIQAEIDAAEASLTSLYQAASVTSDQSSITNQTIASVTARIDLLYKILDNGGSTGIATTADVEFVGES